MFEYKATVVGPLSSLRREKKVEDVGVSLADAYTAALNHYGSQGWKLHSVVAISSPIVLLVFEKYVCEYPPDPTDPEYGTSTITAKDVPITYTDSDVPVSCKCRCKESDSA